MKYQNKILGQIICAGLLTGMGVGFLTDELNAGILWGLGAGLAMAALAWGFFQKQSR